MLIESGFKIPSNHKSEGQLISNNTDWEWTNFNRRQLYRLF